MSLEFANPFADYGTIVYGERFVGREASLRIVESRIIRPNEPGNLAIIGDYRIGKSSLIYKSVMERKKELLARKLIPIWINLATYDHVPSFFRSLTSRCYEEMENLGWMTDTIKLAFDRASQDEVSRGEGYGRIQRFFEKVRQSGFRVLFILDEFDHARHLFKGDVSGFQGLRELSYRPEWRVTFITTSRRSLHSIESQTQAISTFDLTFHKHYLGMFNESEVQECLARLSSIGIEITPILKERMRYYCGGHPYLLEMLSYELVELFRESQVVDVDEAARRVERSFLDQYDHIVRILSEDNSLNKLLQVLFGPVVDVRQNDIDELLRYGLICLTDQGDYAAFSAHFQIYLKLIARQSDLWPLWRDTERSLRQVVTTKMLEQYGEDWINELEKARPNLKSLFDECRKAQQREERAFGSRASHNLIDFTYPQQLFEIVFAEWNAFQPILGKDKNYWHERSRLLAKIRNPLAHNRDEVLYNYERRIAEGYCEEILETLRCVLALSQR